MILINLYKSSVVLAVLNHHLKFPLVFQRPHPRPGHFPLKDNSSEKIVDLDAYRYKKISQENFDLQNQITKILIFRTDRIGDLVNTSPFLKSLKNGISCQREDVYGHVRKTSYLSSPLLLS